jgi:hypothetical protein
MIKFTLIKFIRTFNFSQLTKDLNRYFFFCLLFLCISLTYLFLCQYLYVLIFGQRTLYGEGFFEKIYFLLMFNIKGQTTAQLTSFLLFHAFFIYQLKYNESRTSITGQRSLEYYFLGIFILVLMNVLFGFGVDYLYSKNYYEYGLTMSERDFLNWFNSLLLLIMPFMGSWLSVVFIRRLMNVKRELNPMTYFFSILILCIILSAVLNEFSHLIVAFIIDPLKVFFRQNAVFTLIITFIYAILVIVTLLIQTYLISSIMSLVIKHKKADVEAETDLLDQ